MHKQLCQGRQNDNKNRPKLQVRTIVKYDWNAAKTYQHRTDLMIFPYTLIFWTNTYRPPAVLYKVWVGKWLRLTTELGWAQLSDSDLVVMEVGLIALTLSLSFSSSSFCCRFSISALKFSMSCWLKKIH